jgi:translation initiation factor IF-3
VRLIDEEGEQVGVVPTDEARRRAKDAGLDLVEVAPEARPPVCKILDYGRFKYEVQKKEKRSKSSSSASTLKEMRVRPAISPHDLGYRLKDGRKFLGAGHKVLVVCMFRGRQMAHPEHGHDVMRRVAEDLGDIARVETSAKLMGRRMSMLLAPTSAAKRGSSKSNRPPKVKSAPTESAPSGPDLPQQTGPSEAPVSQPETETAPKAVAQPETETAPKAVAQPETETAPKAVSQPETETAPKAVSQPETETAPKAVSQPETETAPETGSDS